MTSYKKTAFAFHCILLETFLRDLWTLVISLCWILLLPQNNCFLQNS